MAVPPTPFTATVLGLPRIGPNRELHHAVETYLAGALDADRLHAAARELRLAHLSVLAAAGLDSIPVGTFSYHDQMLDTAALFGALPARVRDIDDPLDRYFAAARGTATHTPLDQAPWFGTGYHHLVPEIDASTRFTLHAENLLAELAEARELGVPARPVVIGPLTFLTRARHATGDPLDRLPELIPRYRELLTALADAGAAWVQLDEPILGTELTGREIARLRTTYAALASTARRPALLVAIPFGPPGPALAALADMGIDGVALDFTAGTTLEAVASVPALTRKLVVAGVVDGRDFRRTDLDAALRTLGSLLGSAGSVAVSSSCSLLHVPYSLSPETALDERVRSWLAFGAEKVTEVAVLAGALTRGTDAVAPELAAARAAVRARPDQQHDDAPLGVVTTEHGWVQSSGADCVRPPIPIREAARPVADSRRFTTPAVRNEVR